MKGKVIFSNDVSIEVDQINSLSKGYLRKFYIYGNCSVDEIKIFLPDFLFIKLQDIINPENITVVVNNTAEDFFVIKNLRFSDVMHKGVDRLQLLKGYKLVIDEHPFLGKFEIYWCYFLWSFFDRSLLGYPHCYAFQTFLKNNSVNCSELAKKVSSKTECYIKKIFFNDIVVKKIPVCNDVSKGYQDLKEKLFEQVNTPKAIIKGLKRYLDQQMPELKTGFDLMFPGRIYDQYKKGLRTLIISDQKVDLYLESEFWGYIKNTNLFIETLWNQQHN